MEIKKVKNYLFQTIHGKTYVINNTCGHDEGLFYIFLILDKKPVLKEVNCAKCGTTFTFKKKKILHRHFRNDEFVIFKQCDCETDDLIYQFHKSVSDPFLIRVLCDQCKKECKFERKALF